MQLKEINGNKWVLALVAGALAAILVVLVAKTSSREFDFSAASVVVRDLKQVDAQWNVDVLGLDAGLHNNFDQIVARLPEIRRLSAQLREMTDAYGATHPEAGAELTRKLDAFEIAMEKKIQRVELIKSSHAILTNSSRFLSEANLQFLAAMHVSEVPENDTVLLERALNGMLTAAVSELITPDAASRESLMKGAASIRSHLGRLPPQLSPAAETLLAHVDVLGRQRDTSKVLLAQLAALPTVQVLDALHDDLMKEMARQMSVQKWYRGALIGYAVALLLLLAYAGRLLYKHYQSLNQSNEQLKATNSETQMLLIQSAKMSAIGQMVAGVAHEINSPLAYVKATFCVIRELLTAAQENPSDSSFNARLQQPTKDREQILEVRDEESIANNLIDDVNSLLDDGMHGIEQISELIMTLKNFSRIDRAKRSDVALSDGLNSALAITRYMLKHTVDVKKEYGDVPHVHCSPSQINQVFLNIITNAAQAMGVRKEKGQITLRTSTHGEDMVRVEIQDNGSGIPPDVLPRIFDPFFTTKNPGEGTGAGLAICRQIIENHGGQILVDSKLGVGTTFSILLPVEDRQKPDHPQANELVGA